MEFISFLEEISPMCLCVLHLSSFQGVLFVKELLPIVNWALADICGLSNETQSESDLSHKLTNYIHPHVTDYTCHYECTYCI